MSSIVQLTPDMTKSDILALYNGEISYVLYKTNDKYKKLLGDKCYIVANKQQQQYFIRSKGVMALTLDDLKQKISAKDVVKIVLEGKEVNDVQINEGWGCIYNT